MSARLSQVDAEALVTGAPKVRASAVALEILGPTTVKARLTQIDSEVLVTGSPKTIVSSIWMELLDPAELHALLSSCDVEALAQSPPLTTSARLTEVDAQTLVYGLPKVRATFIASEILTTNPTPPLPPYPARTLPAVRSYLTQDLQNYFDDSDARIRGFRSTLDAQLLNAAAVPMETHGLRMRREIAGRYPATCPLNLDSRGVYTRAQLPVGFVLDTDADGNLQLPAGTAVYGTRGTQVLPLPVFDDTLPVPTRIELDSQRQPVSLANPVLWQSPEIVSANPVAPQVLEGVPLEASLGVLGLPNRLSIWVDNLGSYQGSVTILIEGEPTPQILWPGQNVVKTESIDTTTEGLIRTNTAWATVTRLLVYGLPAGASVTVYGLDIGLPQIPDPDRPYIDPRFRGVEFARYWQIDSDPLNGDWVNELYYQNRDVGLGIAQSYRSGQALSQLVIEPNTFGMFGFRKRDDVLNTPPAIFYFDRREPLPASLASAALTREPYFGLDVQFNVFQRAPRGVLLYPAPYSGAAKTQQWRLLVEIPGGETVTVATPSACQALSIIVPGSARPWLYSDTLNSGLEYSRDYARSFTGSTPTIVGQAAGLTCIEGRILQIAYAGGLVNSGVSEGLPYADANGYLMTSPPSPLVGALNDQSAPDYGVAPSYYMDHSKYPILYMELLGCFTGSNGQVVGLPFPIGDGPVRVTIPAGATQLQLGVNDWHYGTNVGSFTVSITDVTPAAPASILSATGPFSYSQDSNGVWKLGILNERLWQTGSLPKEIPFTLGAAGTYVFTLETRGPDGTVTTDSYPYANLELTGQPPAGIELPDFVLEGIALDYRQRLWGWTGDTLLPLALHYDAFTFDADSLSLYLTDPFDQVQIS